MEINILQDKRIQELEESGETLVPIEDPMLIYSLEGSKDFPFVYCYVDDVDDPHFYAHIVFKDGYYKFKLTTDVVDTETQDTTFKDIRVSNFTSKESCVEAMKKYLKQDNIIYFDVNQDFKLMNGRTLDIIDTYIQILKDEGISMNFNSIYDHLKDVEMAKDEDIYKVFNKLKITESMKTKNFEYYLKQINENLIKESFWVNLLPYNDEGKNGEYFLNVSGVPGGYNSGFLDDINIALEEDSHVITDKVINSALKSFNNLSGNEEFKELKYVLKKLNKEEWLNNLHGYTMPDQYNIDKVFEYPGAVYLIWWLYNNKGKKISEFNY